MGKPNKYSALFDKNMTSEEARLVLSSNIDGLSDEDRELLWQAYFPVSHEILKAELNRDAM